MITLNLPDLEFQYLDDFVLFLFVHIAWVDGSIHPTEKDTITEKMQELFPDVADVEQKLTLVESQYRGLGPGQAEIMLKTGTSTFSNIDPKLKRAIHEGLVDIINSNGKIDSAETATLRHLKSWLTS